MTSMSKTPRRRRKPPPKTVHPESQSIMPNGEVKLVLPSKTKTKPEAGASKPARASLEKNDPS